MKNHKSPARLPMTLCFSLFLLAPQIGFAQSEKLGVVQYTPPKGWKKSTNGNVVAFSEHHQATGIFCIITLHGATEGSGSPERDFKNQWYQLVVKPLQAAANPQTETETVDGWTAIAGGTAIEFQGSKAFAFLTVLSNGATTVSILGVFNKETYLAQLAAFNSSIELTGVTPETPAPQPRQPMPQPPSANASAMHAAALVKEFENNEVRANQVWIGKRVRIYGTVNNIELNNDGMIILTFKSSTTTYKSAQCYFNKSQSSRVAALSAHTEATVEGTVRGLGGGFANSKAFLVLDGCVVP